MAGASGIAAVVSAIAGKFDPNKHKRGAGGKFAFQGGAKPKPSAGKGSGSVAAAHALFEKMKGKPKKDVLAAAQAIGINPNTAKTQLYHWQKKQATEALAGIKNPTKEQMQQAVASAIGVKGVKAPEPAPAPKVESEPAPKPAPKAEPTPVTATPKEAPSLEKLGPTKYVHALADHLKGKTRKEVIQHAVAAGVHPSTASVQYSKWQKKQNGEPFLHKVSPEPKHLAEQHPSDLSTTDLKKALSAHLEAKAPPQNLTDPTKASIAKTVKTIGHKANNGVRSWIPLTSSGKAKLAQLKPVFDKSGVSFVAPSQNAALKTYTGLGFKKINQELRANKGDVANNSTIKKLDEVISKSKFAESTIVYRGFSDREGAITSLINNGSLVEHGYSSTSLDPSQALAFSSGSKTIFRIHVPKGFNGVATGNVANSVDSMLTEQAEILLPRGVKYTVVGKTKGGAYDGKFDVVDLVVSHGDHHG